MCGIWDKCLTLDFYPVSSMVYPARERKFRVAPCGVEAVLIKLSQSLMHGANPPCPYPQNFSYFLFPRNYF